MALVRAQVTLQPSNAIGKDVVTNTLYFGTTGSDPSPAATLIAGALEDMYTDVPTGGSVSIQSFFSTEMAQNGHRIRLYNMADSEPRVPFYDGTFNLSGAPNGDPLPGEVALCLSYQADRVSGMSQARRRGRIYFGRFDKDSATNGRPSALLVSTLAQVGDTLLAASAASSLWEWVVYSPTAAAAGSLFPTAPVTNGWVDNAFDTQRRRGLSPTSKTLFS